MHAAPEPGSPPPASAAGSAPRLQIRNLQHTYANGVQALAGVDLDVPRGMYGLLGPNGAGKSTLMRIVATLQQPTAGSVTFDGADIIADPFAIRRVLGYLPQEFGVYPRISAEDLLDHLAVLKGVGPAKVRREQVDALLEQTNLYDARKRAVSTYSGGMRQRFGIAQALLGNPQIIIVDEPTAGLDPTERHRFHELLSEIGATVAVILSTHLLDDVSRLCTRAAILFGGRVVADGELSSLVATLHGRDLAQDRAARRGRSATGATSTCSRADTPRRTRCCMCSATTVPVPASSRSAASSRTSISP